MADLTTTNILLGILATVSVLEALAVIGVLWGAFMLYRRTLALVAGIEERHVTPVTTRVNAILDDVKGVTSVVENVTKGAEAAAKWGVGQLFERFKTSGTS